MRKMLNSLKSVLVHQSTGLLTEYIVCISEDMSDDILLSDNLCSVPLKVTTSSTTNQITVRYTAEQDHQTNELVFSYWHGKGLATPQLKAIEHYFASTVYNLRFIVQFINVPLYHFLKTIFQFIYFQ